MGSNKEKEAKDPVGKAIASLKLRGVGPALMGGRISYIAVHPQKKSTWYLAVGSGNLWKTTNAGITWKPIFDDQPSYSIGTVAIDPTTPETVWVGTGEKVSGRHVAWGDGIYKSLNGGQTWENMGLKRSEHIAKILIDPRDGNTVLVAAEGPLWAAGGERGVYKTTDGGQSWHLVLEIDENTGVTDIEFDPSNPDIIYAAAYQRRRHVYSFLSGGPNSGIYKSTDNGDSWRKITVGLPKTDMGKIGLAVTPADPNLVFATIEANQDDKGFYRSADKGESWEKRSSYTSGGTGPHYYQEIEASPQDPDTIYQMDVFVHATKDGGKTFKSIETGKSKHSDNHALWIDPADGDHMLLGCDAGLYESFDAGGSWRHFPNLPVSQFYRVALDNSEPFFNILGGAQDLGTLFGPSRTTNMEGVRNQDWYVPLGADGYHTDFDPTDPMIMFVTWQNGNIYRYDRRSEESVDIKPLAAPGEPPERWNWDAPFFISRHNANRLYMASHRVWRSDDQGNSWTAISPDLTLGTNRYELPHMGRVWSVDDLNDNFAMSGYATIAKIAESPVQAGLLYASTDDGLIQVSEDDGGSWRRAADLPGVPERSFIIFVGASEHDADTVYAIADAHKQGDFNPYLFVSTDRGQSWQSLRGDLPDGTILWAIQQDHVEPNLLFLAAEYGLYTSLNGGENWHKLGGVPTMAFRDLKIQRRDNDLVGASFGRGFYVFDDYSPLRDMANGALDNEAHLFPVRDAWWYIELVPMQSPGQPTLGDTSFVAPNPPFGAVFTYHLKEKPLTAKEARQKTEKELRENGADTPFPGFDALRAESLEEKPQILLLVRDAAGGPVRWLEGSTDEGVHRVAWDLRLPSPDPIDLHKPEEPNPWSLPATGALVAPGEYSVELVLVSRAGVQNLSAPQSFNLKPVPTTVAGTDFAAAAAFQRETSDLLKEASGIVKELERARDRLRHVRAALLQTPGHDAGLYARIDAAQNELDGLESTIKGNPRRQKLAEPDVETVNRRLWRLTNQWFTRQQPTQTALASQAQAAADLATVKSGLQALLAGELAQLEADIAAAGAPWTPGRALA